jgi:predicted subunit of tRNA(5-methylaminomethyl-2-thiouridylate) methyltransferase
MSDFQWIIEKAESISINRKKMVGQTTARDGKVRTVSRGSMPKTFTVKVADGILWSGIKDSIAAAEALDRISTATITIDYATHPWYYGNVSPATEDSWTVRCIQFPEWTIFARNQVSWSGPFIFQEVT